MVLLVRKREKRINSRYRQSHGRNNDAIGRHRVKSKGKFHYGRYLLISSSRPGTQAANLQGIWNCQVQPPWSSNWTANINVQMNYWLAETCNLSDCTEPLLTLIEGLSHTGARAAQETYGLPG
jgi:hypothetical protein